MAEKRGAGPGCRNPSKSRKVLGWEPKIKYRQLVRIMMDADLELLGLDCPGEGKKILAETFAGSWHHWGNTVVSMENETHEC